MIIDHVKGGIKVFNGDEKSEESGEAQNAAKALPRRLKPVLQMGKRKTWRSADGPKASEGTEIQISKSSADENGTKKTPIQRKTRSEATKEPAGASFQLRKARSGKGGVGKSVDSKKSLFKEANEKSEETCKEFGVCRSSSLGNAGQAKLPPDLMVPDEERDEGCEEIHQEIEIERGIDNQNPSSDATKKSLFKEANEKSDEFGVCRASSLGNAGQAKPPPDLMVPGEGDDGCEEIHQEIEIEKEIDNQNPSSDAKKKGKPEDEPEKSIIADQNLSKLPPPSTSPTVHNPAKSIPSGAKSEISQVRQGIAGISLNLEKRPPLSPSRTVDRSLKPALELQNLKNPSLQTPSKQSIPCVRHSLPTIADLRKQSPPYLTNLSKHRFRRTHPASEEFRKVPETSNNLQNLVELVMWRDVSKSALVFGVGTFIMLSSSYAGDFNISLISIVSYLGLLYLAAIFLYRSIICREAVDAYDSSQCYVIGEEEALWLLRLFLPYMNEFLLKLRSLFSGDPVTTINLAVLLFLLARWGDSITVWKMVKLGFFGAFTIPKVYYLYSFQITAYGKFWIRRFRDAWESCSQKKAAAGAMFIIVWNLSSVVARVWVVFVLFVAVRYYQQSVMSCAEEESDEDGGAWQEQAGGGVGRRRGSGPALVELMQDTKGCQDLLSFQSNPGFLENIKLNKNKY